jgi:hypothetical protein
MARSIIRLGMAVVFGLSLSWGADADKKAEKKAEKQAAESKASYLQKAEGEVQEWTAKLKSLQERSEKSGTKTREDLDRHVQVVDRNLAIARKKLDELRASSEGAWNTLRKGLEEALDKVGRDYQKAVSFFNKSEKKVKTDKK